MPARVDPSHTLVARVVAVDSVFSISSPNIVDAKRSSISEVTVKWGVVMRMRTGGCGSVDVLSFRPHDADRPTGGELPRPTSTRYYQIQSLLVRNTSKGAHAVCR